jgi:hypothetical protein
MTSSPEDHVSDPMIIDEAEENHDLQPELHDVHPLPLVVENYIFRGEELEYYSIYELTCMTCPKNTTATEKDQYVRACESLKEDQSLTWNHCVFFQQAHSKAKSRWISFLREPKVPCIVGNLLSTCVH